MPTAAKYILAMFPYPSGKLHLGHFRNYIIQDVLTRYTKQLSQPVISPMGWDSFGLPAENASKLNKKDPAEYTRENIALMKTSFKKFNCDIDWGLEIDTSDHRYYKHTQALFLLLFKHGLAYQKKQSVNWDPIDKTVLANEQCIDGRAERSGAIVERKLLTQWFFKTSAYQQDLMDGLEKVDWPESVKAQQRNWIAKTDSYSISMRIVHANTSTKSKLDSILVYHTNPSDIIANGFCVLGPNHTFASTLSNIKNGMFAGIYVEYHDIVKEIYIKIPCFISENAAGQVCSYELYSEKNSFHRKYVADFLKMNADTCVRNPNDWTVGHVFQPDSIKNLQDWLISRQRYWGTPIPIVHCVNCGAVPVLSENLPILLSKDYSSQCPRCGIDAKRDTDSMDTFVDSSWYYLRFLDPQNTNELMSVSKQRQVDVYIGGKEHSIMHLLYSRFICKVLNDYGGLSIEDGEPFKKLLTQGMVTSATYKVNGKYYPSEQVNDVASGAYLKMTNEKTTKTIEKMSKSKFNGIDPGAIIDQYGLDSTRLYILYKAAPQDDLVWTDSGIVGMQKFIKRLQLLVKSHIFLVSNVQENKSSLSDECQKTAEKLTFIMENSYKFNQAITLLMKLTTIIKSVEPCSESRSCLIQVLRMLYPFIPETSAILLSNLKASTFKSK